MLIRKCCRPVVSYAKAGGNRSLSHAVRNSYRGGGGGGGHSGISTYYSGFPATLMRLNPGVGYKQVPIERQGQSSDNGGESRDEHANTDVWTNILNLNSARLMPNTMTMQEIVRMAADYYMEDIENNVSIERPFIFTIPKGTVIPATLTLLREDVSQFSLQPSRSTSPNDLLNILHEFYATHADKQDVFEWLDNHAYEDAIGDEKESEWMAR